MDAEMARKYLPYIGGTFAICIALALLFVLPNRGPAEIPPADQGALRIQGDHVIYAPGNVQFTKASDWDLVSPATISLPKDLSGAQFSFQKRGTSCIFAYATMPSTEMYKQTSFAERVFSGQNRENQFDSSWYIHVDELPEGFQFQWEGKQAFPREVRIIPQSFIGRWNYEGGGMNGFLLYDALGASVADECDFDVNRMLETLVEWYEPVVITTESVGELYIKDRRMLFLGADNIPRIAYPLVQYMQAPVVHDGKIYMNNEDRSIAILDPITGSLQEVQPALEEGEVINAQYALHGSLFLLVGERCSDGPRDCDNRLIEYALAIERTIFLADVTANFILGFDTEENALYVSQSFGDAGCFNAEVSKYTVRGGVIEDVGSYGGCEGDTGVEVSRAEYTALLSRIGNGRSQVSHIDVKNGQIHYPANDSASDQGSWPMIFVR